MYNDNAEREIMIRRDFHRHQATVITLTDGKETVTILKWQEPGTWINAVHYMIRKGWLFVCGDLGEAVYQWNTNQLELGFLAGCSLDYFASKCQASETGRGGKEWDPDYARRHFLGRVSGNYEVTEEVVMKALKEAPAFSDWDRWEWHSFIHENPSLSIPTKEGDDVHTVELYEYGDIGYRESWRTQMHLVGLKMAHEQLQAGPVTAVTDGTAAA